MNTVEIWILKKSMISIQFFLEESQKSWNSWFDFSFTFQNNLPWTFSFHLEIWTNKSMKYIIPFSQVKWHIFIKVMRKSREKYIQNVQLWIKLNLILTSKKWMLDQNGGQKSVWTLQKRQKLIGNELGTKKLFHLKKKFFDQKIFLNPIFWLWFSSWNVGLDEFSTYKISKIVSTVEAKDRMNKRPPSRESWDNFRILNFLNFSTTFVR